MDLNRIEQVVEEQIECCQAALKHHGALDKELARRDAEGLRAWSVQQQEDALRLQKLNRKLHDLLGGRRLSDLAQTLPQSESGQLLEKSRELARITADLRLANARSFRFLRRTASTSQSMLEQVYGMAGGYDNRGNMMNSYRNSY